MLTNKINVKQLEKKLPIRTYEISFDEEDMMTGKKIGFHSYKVKSLHALTSNSYRVEQWCDAHTSNLAYATHISVKEVL